jgi:aminomuconate-semialdehyde/2-hydroxymuconate-6-semialdehyde dehydrogenase
MEQLLNYINGELTVPRSGCWLDNYNPATGQVFAQVPDSDESDIDSAVQAAAAAFPAWAALRPDERAVWLDKLSAAILTNLESLAADETTDNGKTLRQSREVEIPRAASNFRFFAQAITQFSTEAHASDPHTINYTLRQPLGVIAAISPWNLPLYLFSWKIAPALAAGNTVVAKPSEITPLTAYRLAQLCVEIGFPPGVLNIVHGSGMRTGNALVNHSLIKAVTFTGSTRTGAQIAAAVAPKFKKLSLELGGKNPALVFDDCDYAETVSQLARASFSNQGEICLCSSKILVQKTLYEKFRNDFVAKVSSLRVGDPMHADTQVGAIVSPTHFEKILYHIQLAKEEGATVLCGGHALQPEGAFSGGWYIAPTVLEGLPNDCRTNQEEIFGPVVTLQSFEDEAEALALANQSEYGLSATLWTGNSARTHRLAAQLQAGIIWVNTWLHRDLRTPFGGMKNSGVGREGGWEALRFFTEPKNVCIKY